LNQRALAIFLAVLCVASGGLAIYTLSQAVKRRPLDEGEPPEWAPYKCSNPKCGYAFRRTTADSYTLSQMRAEDPEAKGAEIGCPKCGKKTALLAKHCPKCKRWYLPAIYFDRESPYGIRCPQCGTMRSRKPPIETLPAHSLDEIKGSAKSGKFAQ